jgi:hypothetical protein
MTLFLQQDAGAGRAFRRVTLAWDADGHEAELVLTPGGDGRVRIEVTIGGEREEHELELRERPQAAAVRSQSKLIQIEDTHGRTLAAARRPQPKPVVNKQSKLIQIEDMRATIPDMTVFVD